MDRLRTAYQQDLARTFRHYKSLGDGALAQVSDEDLHTLVDPDANTIAIVMKHVAGNLRSRFTDFLTVDGEKPDRNRDGEFEMPVQASRGELMIPIVPRRQRRLEGGKLRQILHAIRRTLARNDALERQDSKGDAIHLADTRPFVLDGERFESMGGEHHVYPI